MKTKIALWIVLIALMVLASSCATNNTENIPKPNEPTPPNPDTEIPIEQRDLIKEQILGMSLKEKLGQMLIAGVEGYEADADVIQLIQVDHIGGFILFGSNIQDPTQLLKLTNALKESNKVNKTPIFISVDEEGGRISRIPKVIVNLPASKAVGDLGSKAFSYEVGTLLADKVKAFGFNLNFAPVLDINSNPKNPVIGDRSFGDKAELVKDLGIQTMHGIADNGVIPVLKHFPGHGDTSVDSHVGLPSVNSSLERLESFELIPFRAAIAAGADCVMVAHILLPKLDDRYPATLSEQIITELLRKQLGFQGVIITDDMTMGAISKNYDLAEAALLSVKAGSDIVLIAHKYQNIRIVYEALEKAVLDGAISEERIDESVYRILKLKEKYHLKDMANGMPDIEKINKSIQDVLDRYQKQ